MSTRANVLRRFERFAYTMLGLCAAIGAACLLKGTPVQAQPGINLTALYNQVQALQATVNSQATQISGLNARLTVVEGKTQYQSASFLGNTTTFSRCNVIVNDGSGSTTGGSTGLGNLIIGYNFTRGFDIRTGTNNLVVGDYNNYASGGGIVAGQENYINGDYSTITGGAYNETTDWFSSISGGTGLSVGYLGWAGGSQGTSPISGNFSSP